MQRNDLKLLLVEANRLTHADEILVIGSQSVLATWSEQELPESATRSLEADMLVRRRRGVALTDPEAERLTQLLEQSGILSDFDAEHGVYIDPVSMDTAALPEGWEDRLVPFEAFTDDGRTVTGVCLDPYDACASKVVALRSKDQTFVAALVEAGLIDPEILLERLTMYSGAKDINHAFVYVQGFLR